MTKTQTYETAMDCRARAEDISNETLSLAANAEFVSKFIRDLECEAKDTALAYLMGRLQKGGDTRGF